MGLAGLWFRILSLDVEDVQQACLYPVFECCWL